MTHLNSEEIFDQTMEEIYPRLKQLASYDMVIGIPFNEESHQLLKVLESIDEVLNSWIGRRQLIVCAGDYSARETLDLIQGLKMKHPHLEFVLPLEISGRGTAIRAMLEISKRLEADLLIFSAKMATPEGPGIDTTWLESLLTPIQGNYDLVLGSLRRYLGIDSVAHMLAAPILESFYGYRMSEPLGGIYAISHELVEELAHEAIFWSNWIQGYGIDFWILTRALCWNKCTCEINIGSEQAPHSLEKRNQIFYDTILTMFEAIKRDSAIWMQDKLVLKVADMLSRSTRKKSEGITHPMPQLIDKFRAGYQAYKPIFERHDHDHRLQDLLSRPEMKFNFDDELWISLLYDFMFAYTFGPEEEQMDLCAAFTSLYNGRVASYALELRQFNQQLKESSLEGKDELLIRKIEAVRQRLTDVVWSMKGDFVREWVHRSEQSRPPLVPLGYMEYVPGKPIVIPKKIVGKDRRVVETDHIFKDLRKQYGESFNRFASEGLGLAPDASPQEMSLGVENFMADLEGMLEELLPGDLHKRDGVSQFVDTLFNLLPRHRMFTIHSDVLREMLVRFPPVNLMIPLGFYKPADLIDAMGTRDAVTFSNLIESRSYTDRDLEWLADTLKPESFEWVEIKPIILNENLHMGILARGKISHSNHITARIPIKPLEYDSGGQYARIRYFMSILRRMVAAEHYSSLFRGIVSERKNIGRRLYNSLVGWTKGDDFSAHTIFENSHHRGLVEKIRYLADKLGAEGQAEPARLLRLTADGYSLAQVMEDNSFLTCSAWSWASYNFKGGQTIPGPWTTTVESRWFNHHFLEKLYQNLGYDVDSIIQIVHRLIQSGESTHNLLDTLLPARPKDVDVVVQEPTDKPSKHLVRYQRNPILEPIKEHYWESKYVLNPGSLRIGDQVYLFYRAVGDDDVSHIGLAVTDGYEVVKRLPEPIFSPVTPEERMGCEDPRLIRVGDRIYMLYTAYDGNIAQIAAASIAVDDLLNERYRAWRRDGLAFKNIWDKDAILFPDRINGKYVIYHRIEPSIWVTYMHDIKFPIKEKHAIIAGPRPGRMWDSLKIGAGAQPIKTRHGWLLIYHGVDYNYVYSLGVLLVDLENPQKVIYRSPNPILEPEEDYEIGLSGAWVPNVVFTCGAVGAEDKEILGDDDEVLVYYGAADTSIGVATATVGELIPDEFRIN